MQKIKANLSGCRGIYHEPLAEGSSESIMCFWGGSYEPEMEAGALSLQEKMLWKSKHKVFLLEFMKIPGYFLYTQASLKAKINLKIKVLMEVSTDRHNYEDTMTT